MPWHLAVGKSGSLRTGKIMSFRLKIILGTLLPQAVLLIALIWGQQSIASLITGLICFVLSYLSSIWISDRLAHGFSELHTGAERISNGQAGYQVDVRGRDEISKTAAAFNEMSEKLHFLDQQHTKKEKHIQHLTEILEQRVAERTAQLRLANMKLEHQATHDTLTGLPNRALFNDRLSIALANARRMDKVFAVMCVDLDKFKDINDTLGHHVGDLVLQHVTRACNEVLRETDTVARMGGDEFALLLPNVTDMDQSMVVAERLLDAIRQPLKIGPDLIEVGASIGVAMFPQHGKDEESLVTRSDAAMYAAKRKKAGVVAYQPGENKPRKTSTTD